MKPRAVIILGLTAFTRQVFAAVTALQSTQSKNVSVPTVFLPLNFYFGPNHKISTDIVLPWNNVSIEVVYDQGSENFFVFGPNAVDNWGCTGLFCQGQCNASVTTFYDNEDSPSASEPAPFSFQYIYGGFDKIYRGDTSVNDTLVFNNVGGQSSTISNLRFGLADYLQQRLRDGGMCAPAPFDLGIMGVAPVQYGPTWNTTGPSVRSDLLEQGVIDAPVQCVWFDEAPSNVTGTYTGGALFGGVDTSKFIGPLVKLPVLRNDRSGASVGYYVPVPTTSVNGVVFEPVSNSTTSVCLLDSGTHNDDLPISFAAAEALFNATGITRSPAGYIAWPGTCQSIPANITIDLEWRGLNSSETVTVKIPIRAYARNNLPLDEAAGYCTLSLDSGGCVLGAPFTTAAFFAADDEKREIALAQGGISKSGAGVDEAAVVLRIP